MSEKIKVAIKVRPLIEREKAEGAQDQWTVSENSMYLTSSKTKDKYYFDYIFGQEKTNADLFEVVTKPIVDASVRGFNGTIFAYGQTSSGKTYTMMGSEQEPGIIPQTINYIFEAIHNITSLEGRNFLLRASYMEIYNERIIDLLEGKKGLKLREADGQVVIVQLKEEVACTAEKILDLMKRGEKMRKTSQTNMNERSSRSHTIFRIIIESGLQDEEENGAVQVSHLNLVDLAGSERVDQSGAIGERLKEGCSINTSLFMLARVISQLSEGQEQHVSFRDSKLTRILQSSLGGNAHTAIICTVTPAVIDETVSTLGFASRAANIRNRPLKNEVLTDEALLKRYARQIAKLQEELKKTKHSSKSSAEIESKLEETKRHNQLLKQRIDLLQEKLIGSTLLDSVALEKKRALRRRTWGGQTTNPRFSVHQPQRLSPIEEGNVDAEEDCSKVFSTSVADFQCGGFETPLEEFELELLEAERIAFGTESTISDDSYITKRKKGRTVSFADENFVLEYETPAAGFEEGTFSSESECLCADELIYCETDQPASTEVGCQTDDQYSGFKENAVNTTLELTSDDTCPKPCNKCLTIKTPNSVMKDANCQTEAAILSDQCTSETPPRELRERAEYIKKEYEELQEFTTLEKQINSEELTALLKENKQLRREIHGIRKCFDELEKICLESNRSLSIVKDENKDLKQQLKKEVAQCSELSKSISLLNKAQEKTKLQLKDVTALEKEMEALKQKLHFLENEKRDFEMIKQLQEEKYKKRITELSKSLEEAWQQNETVNKEMMDSSCEGCRRLTKELETLKTGLDKVNFITSQEDANELHMQDTSCVQKQDECNNLLAEKEKAINVLSKKLSEAENKIVELTRTVEAHADCTSVLREKDVALMSLQEQLASKNKLTNFSKESEKTVRLMQEELSKAKTEIMELTELRARYETLKEKEECYVASQKELEERNSELTVILKEKEEKIVLLRERLRGAENNLEKLEKLREEYSTCVDELKVKQKTVFTLQAQLASNEKVIKGMTKRILELQVNDLYEEEQTKAGEVRNDKYVEILEEAASLKKQLAEKEKRLEESEIQCLKLTENLKEKEESTAVLQRDLVIAQNQMNDAAKIIRLHEKCEHVIEESQQTISMLKEQVANSEQSILDKTQKCSEAIDALKKCENSCSLLQEKLNYAENDTVLASLKEQLASYQISLSEMEQIHSEFILRLKEKDERLLYLEEKLTNKEIFAMETTQNCAKLAEMFRGIEERINYLEQKVHETENSKEAYMQALEEKDKSLLTLQENLNANEEVLIYLNQRYSNLKEILKSKEETIAVLKEELCNLQTELEAEKNIHSQSIQELREKDELLLDFERKMTANEISAAEIMQYCSKLAVALRGTEENINALEQKLREAKNYKRETKKKMSVYEDTLKQKGEIISHLEQKLLEFQTKISGEEIHSQCIQKLREKDELLLDFERKMTANEISAAEIMQYCSKLAVALRGTEENINALEQKLREAKNYKRETKKKMSVYEDTLKQKGEIISHLEQKLLEFQTKISGEEIHSQCIQKLREKDELLLDFERKMTANEISAAEIIQYCSKLAVALRGTEENINALEQKLREAKNYKKETKKKMSVYEDTLKQKGEIISHLEQKLLEFQTKISGEEIHSQCIQKLREKDELLLDFERKMTANEISAAEIIQYCSKLAVALRGTEENINALEQKLREAKNYKRETKKKMSVYEDTLKQKGEIISHLEQKLLEFQTKISGEEIHSQCIQKLREKDELLLDFERKMTANEISAAEIIQYCSKLAVALRGTEENINALEQKLCEAEMKYENIIKIKNTLACNLQDIKQKLNDSEQVKLKLMQELDCKCSEERELKCTLNSKCERNQILTSQIMQLKRHMKNISQENKYLTEQKAKLKQNLRQQEEKNHILEQEAINKDVALMQKQLAFQEEQHKTSKLLLKMEMMEKEMVHLQKEIKYLECSAENSAEVLKRKDEMEQNITKLTAVLASKEDIVQRNEELIRTNTKLELQYNLLQKEEIQILSMLNTVEEELTNLTKKVINRKTTLLKEETIGQSCKKNQTQGGEKSSDLLTYVQQQFILRFQEGFVVINEYLSLTDTYCEKLEHITHEKNILLEELEASKKLLEAEKCKVVQLEKEISSECAINNKAKKANERMLRKAENEREHYKMALKGEQEQRRLLSHDLKEMQSKLEYFKSKNSSVCMHIKDLQVRLEELRNRNEQLKMENDGAAYQIAQLQEEIKELREAKAAKGEECTALRQDIIQLRNEAAEKTTWEERCKSERFEEILKKCQKFEEEIKLYKERVSQLQEELDIILGVDKKMPKTKQRNVNMQGTRLKQDTSSNREKTLERQVMKYRRLCCFRVEKVKSLEQKVKGLELTISRLQAPSEMKSTAQKENKENQEKAFTGPLTENVRTFGLRSYARRNNK